MGLVAWPVSAALIAGAVCFVAFRAFEKYLEHREKKFTHEPIEQLQARIDALESKLLAGAMRR